MRVIILAGVLLGVLPIGMAAQSGVDQPLEGTWALISSIRDGLEVSRNAVRSDRAPLHYTFRADKTYSVSAGERELERGTFTIDPSASPKMFDHVPATGNDPGWLRLGIYEVGNDILKMCISRRVGSRPTAFSALPDSGYTIYIFMRVAK